MDELQQFKELYSRLGINISHCAPEPMEGLKIPEGALHVLIDDYNPNNHIFYWFDRGSNYIGRTDNGKLTLRQRGSQLVEKAAQGTESPLSSPTDHHTKRNIRRVGPPRRSRRQSRR